jgi:pyruvate-formate lyase-activating enzyme
MDWMTPTFTIGGVIVGALLTPYATFLIEKIRIKRNLKSDLIKSVLKLHSLKKMNNHLSNCVKQARRGREITHNQLFNVNLTEAERTELLRQWSINNDSIETNIQEIYQTYHISSDLEAEIQYTLSQIEYYHGTETYNNLDKITEPIIELTDEQYYEYEKLTPDEYNKTLKTLPIKLLEVGKEMDNKAKEMIKEIMSAI